MVVDRFSKVRVDPTTGLVHRDDFAFAKSEGNPVRYGRAGDCYSAASKCHKGRFQIDLSGTGLRMRKEVVWEAWGNPKLPQRLLNYRKSQDGTFASGECGGSCGGCQPRNEKLFVEPSICPESSPAGRYKSSFTQGSIYPSIYDIVLKKGIANQQKKKNLWLRES